MTDNMPTQKLSDCQIASNAGGRSETSSILYDPKCIEHKDAQNIFNMLKSIHAIIIMAVEFGKDVELAHDGRYNFGIILTIIKMKEEPMLTTNARTPVKTNLVEAT